MIFFYIDMLRESVWKMGMCTRSSPSMTCGGKRASEPLQTRHHMHFICACSAQGKCMENGDMHKKIALDDLQRQEGFRATSDQATYAFYIYMIRESVCICRRSSLSMTCGGKRASAPLQTRQHMHFTFM